MTYRRALSRYAIFIALALECLIVGLTTDTFFTSANLSNVLRQNAFIAILAAGVTTDVTWPQRVAWAAEAADELLGRADRKESPHFLKRAPDGSSRFRVYLTKEQSDWLEEASGEMKPTHWAAREVVKAARREAERKRAARRQRLEEEV